MFGNILTELVPGYPRLSFLVWVLGAMLFLYFARGLAHAMIRASSRVIRNSMRFASRSLLSAEKRLVIRNREVLLADGMEAMENKVEREFHRVDASVARELHGFPALQRQLSEELSKIDEDYRESGDVPPTPPAWVSAVDSVASIPKQEGTLVASMLEDIHKTLVKQQKNTVEEYKAATRKRHELLHRMMPYWRKVGVKLEEVDKSIKGLKDRAKFIDGKMQEYEDIRRGTDKAQRTLSSSSLTQFFISGFVLLIAIGGAIINFNLIALPMSEMVGGGSYIGSFKTADVAALVIILVETAMGLYLMESLRITRLFPVIGSLDDKLRKRMILITFSILLILACVESALAFMRDRIALDMQALRQTLAGSNELENSASVIPTVGQMVMGFILPFALTFVAIPLESFVHSSRTVLGVLFQAFLRFLATSLRILGNIAHNLGSVLIRVYDLLIVIPLLLESLVRTRSTYAGARGGDEKKKRFDRDATVRVSMEGGASE